MDKLIQPIELVATPLAMEPCFDLLRRTDPDAPFALFGGAIRDTDYAACHGWPRLVNDYDLRVWLPADNYEEREREYVARLGRVAAAPIRDTPSAGTGRIRYCLTYHGIELDVSLRPAPAPLQAARIAIERVVESDMGLSSVAIAADGTPWASTEYAADRDGLTLTLYDRPDAERRLREYAQKMLGRFPDHQLINLSRYDIPGV